MNKQELINYYENKLEEMPSDWKPLDVVASRQANFRNIIKHLKRLDEPEKPVVPKFVAEWIKQCKKKATLAECLNGYYETGVNKVFSSEDFQNWFLDNENEELIAKAWLFGYEVEKEPTLVVKYADSRGWYFYFTKWSSQNDLELPVMSPCGITAKDDAYKFTDKSKAEALAVLIDGTVEDVQ